MNTLHLTTAPDDLQQASALLAAGETVAIPTETVYGLAANALDEVAVSRIFEAKGRPQDNPLIVHIHTLDTLFSLCADVPDSALLLAEAFWPGPLTIILPKAALVPFAVSGGLQTVAVRMPSHPVARAVIEAAGVPLAAPSANRSGSPSPTTAERVAADLDGRIAAIVCGDACDVGVESTVITLCTEVPRLLRPGGITLEQLQAVIGDVTVDDATLAPLAKGEVAASPGMKYQHYAPAAAVTLLRGDGEAITRYINDHRADGVVAMVFDDETDGLLVPFVTYGAREDDATQAHCVFEALRLTDDMGAAQVYVSCPRAQGLGLAVYNRLLRAAAFRVVTV